MPRSASTTRRATTRTADLRLLVGTAGTSSPEQPARVRRSSVVVLVPTLGKKRKHISASQGLSATHSASIRATPSMAGGVPALTNSLVEVMNSPVAGMHGTQQDFPAAVSSPGVMMQEAIVIDLEPPVVKKPRVRTRKNEPAVPLVKRPRGRPRKCEVVLPQVKRPRGCPRKSAPAAINPGLSTFLGSPAIPALAVIPALTVNPTPPVIPAPSAIPTTVAIPTSALIPAPDGNALSRPPLTNITIAAIMGIDPSAASARSCSYARCSNVLPPLLEYRWRLCESCRALGRQRQCERRLREAEHAAANVNGAEEQDAPPEGEPEPALKKRRKRVSFAADVGSGTDALGTPRRDRASTASDKPFIAQNVALLRREEEEEQEEQDEGEKAGPSSKPSTSQAQSSTPASTNWWLDVVNLTWRRISEPARVSQVQVSPKHSKKPSDARPHEYGSISELCLGLDAAHTNAPRRSVSESGILRFADITHDETRSMLEFYGIAIVEKDPQVSLDEQYVRDLTEEVVYGSRLQSAVRLEDEYVTFVKRSKFFMIMLLCECLSSVTDGPHEDNINTCKGRLCVSVEEEEAELDTEDETILRIEVQVIH